MRPCSLPSQVCCARQTASGTSTCPPPAVIRGCQCRNQHAKRSRNSRRVRLPQSLTYPDPIHLLLLVRRHVDAGPFVLTATLFFVHPPTREELANRVNRRNGDTRPIGRSWDATAHPTIEPIFPLNAIPDTDPRCANLDAEWQQTMATQNAYAATPLFDSDVRHTAHLPREPARLEREAPNTLMFGTSVVNCMKITAASGPDAALYFCLSVRVDLVAPWPTLHFDSGRICQFDKRDSENAANIFQNPTDVLETQLCTTLQSR